MILDVLVGVREPELDRMRVWASLYAMTWLVFVELLLGMMPNAPSYVGYVHVALGVGLVVLSFVNARNVRLTTAPRRVKGTVRSTFQLTGALAILGALVALDVGAGWAWRAVSFQGVALFLHAALGLTVFAQAAATGIAYDMWEEKEFAQETAPGEVPDLPASRKNARVG